MTVIQTFLAKELQLQSISIPTLTLIRGLSMVGGTIYLVRLDLKNRRGNFSFEFDGETFAFLVLRSILAFTALAGSYQSVKYLSMTLYSGLHML